MTTVQILGIEGSAETNRLQDMVETVMSDLEIKADISQVTKVEQLMKYKINGIPALVVNGTVVLQKDIPAQEDLKILLQVFAATETQKFSLEKILVPTDFSPAASGAYRFAKSMLSGRDGCLKAVHVYFPEYDVQNPYFAEPMNIMIETAKGRMVEFLEAERGQNGSIEVSQEVAVGFPVEEILRLSYDSDMIVMGTTGEKGILEKMFGSVSTNVAMKAWRPVMLVPAGAKFSGFRHVLYASDYESAGEGTLQLLADITKQFKADVHFVHVKKGEKDENYKEIENRLFKILFKGGEPGFSFTMSKVEGQSVAEGLNDYAERHQIDLMVMVHPHRSFWDGIFHKSVTKAMALNTRLPILVLPE